MINMISFLFGYFATKSTRNATNVKGLGDAKQGIDFLVASDRPRRCRLKLRDRNHQPVDDN